MMRLMAVLSVCGVFLISCSGDGDGSAIGAPSLRPPIETATPQALKGSSTASLIQKIVRLIPKAYADGTSEITTLKTEIFDASGNGPLHIFNLIGQVDGRMTSLDSRALESNRLCLGEAAQEFSFPTGFKFVHDESHTFDMFFQCQEQLSSELKMAFGIKDGKFYLMEVQSSATNFNGVIMAQADLSSDNVEIWILSSTDSTGGSKYLYISSEKDAGIKFSIGGHTQNNGTTCGLQLAASDVDNRISLEGIFADSMNAGDCTGTNPATTTLCVQSSDLTQVESDCGTTDATDISTLPDLNYTTLFNTAPPSGVSTLNEFNTYAKAAIDSLIDEADFSGLTDFNLDDSEEE